MKLHVMGPWILEAARSTSSKKKKKKSGANKRARSPEL